MMTALSAILNGLGAVDGILGRFFRNKDLAESNVHDEQMAAMRSAAAEFQYRGERTWFDSLVDGLNRLPRPLAALVILGEVFVWPVVDPISFAATMQAYGLVPEWLAILAGQIILLFFGGRMLDKWKMGKGPSKQEVQEVLETAKEIRRLREQAPMDDAAFEREMADESKPLSNAAIMEWNRRRKGRA